MKIIIGKMYSLNETGYQRKLLQVINDTIVLNDNLFPGVLKLIQIIDWRN